MWSGKRLQKVAILTNNRANNFLGTIKISGGIIYNFYNPRNFNRSII
jgi:hypothetical protein